MFIHYRTQGIILGKEKRGEANELFTIYTKEFGKLEILGKAIRKVQSKLRSGAEIFYLSDIEFIQGKRYKTLTDALLIENFENLRKDLKKLRIAYKIAEAFNQLIRGQEKDQKLWDLINETFEKLNNRRLTISNQQLLYFYFFWNFISFLGYTPDFYNCSSCQKKLRPETLFFNPKEGGIICHQCFNKIKKGKQISLNTIKLLRILIKQDWPTLTRLKINQKDLKELSIVSGYSLLYVKKETSGHI